MTISAVMMTDDVRHQAQVAPITNGSKNPTDATLATATNWDTDGEDHREFPIVLNLVNSIA